ncbi:hypothetical protein [Acidisphaera sp. S103]|uniref:hypothetical protein n=1 Tax=Acidisphaera sp. S103 TaxID=1747223 RepID=UPI00131D0DF4|nr:hypothetical protein [Acidisphaera sp. S103]
MSAELFDFKVAFGSLGNRITPSAVQVALRLPNELKHKTARLPLHPSSATGSGFCLSHEFGKEDFMPRAGQTGDLEREYVRCARLAHTNGPKC